MGCTLERVLNAGPSAVVVAGAADSMGLGTRFFFVVGNGHVGGLPLFSQVELVSRLEEWAVVEVLITI